jgi:hypothetical protein
MNDCVCAFSDAWIERDSHGGSQCDGTAMPGGSRVGRTLEQQHVTDNREAMVHPALIALALLSSAERNSYRDSMPAVQGNSLNMAYQKSFGRNTNK